MQQRRLEDLFDHRIDDRVLRINRQLAAQVVEQRVTRVEFEHLDRQMVAHVPYVNGTVVVFVTDLPHMTISITTEQVVPL